MSPLHHCLSSPAEVTCNAGDTLCEVWTLLAWIWGTWGISVVWSNMACRTQSICGCLMMTSFICLLKHWFGQLFILVLICMIFDLSPTSDLDLHWSEPYWSGSVWILIHGSNYSSALALSAVELSCCSALVQGRIREMSTSSAPGCGALCGRITGKNVTR